MLKMVDGTGIIGVDMVCPLGGAASPPQPPNFDKVEMEGVGSLMLPNSLKAPLERLELLGNSVQGENPAPDNPQEIKSVGRFDEASGKYLLDVKVTGKNLLNLQKQPDVKKTYLGWKVSDGRNVVLSVKDKGNNADITGCYLGLSRTGGSADGVVWVVKNGSVAVKEIVSKNQYVSVHPPNETTVRKLLERFDIQVEYGNNATDYEPYTEQSMQIALDEPLRGIGEYKDTITKDGVVRKILKAPLVKYLKPVINGNVGDRYVFAEVPNANINYDRKRCMSNVGFTNSTEKKKYIPHPYQFNFLIRVADDDTIEMVKEKIKDMIVAYTVKEPITEPLSESVQAQLQALHSENGVTHVFVDSGEVPCGIKLTYRKEK